MKPGELQRILVDPFLKSDEHVCPQLIKDALDTAKKRFPHKTHCSKTFGSNTDYDDYNVFDYENYNTDDLESCQELIESYEKAVKKLFGE